MATVRIVPALQPLEDRHPRFGLAAEPSPVEHFALERGEKALGHGIVIRIADGAHGGHHAGVAASFAEGAAGVLAGFKGSSQHVLAGVRVAVR